MSDNRKDSKGRKLKAGEGQRKDGRYYYRYDDISGERRTIYDRDLHELRKKEKEINLQLAQGISYFDGNVPLSEIIDKYFSLKQKWRETTRDTMDGYRNIIKSSKLYKMSINKIKMIDCKTYLVELRESYSYSIVSRVYMLLKESFNLACESDILLKNPCNFKLKSIIDDDSKKKPALTIEQEKSLLQFLKTDPVGSRYLEIFIILLGTGLRISEFAALTSKDIDFAKNMIHVNKQVIWVNKTLKIAEPKTKAAYRDIPMTDDVRTAICSLLEKRKSNKLDVMVDGHVGFLYVGRNGKPKKHTEFSDMFRRILERYNKMCDVPIELCTPHTLRHTFATKLVAAGVDIKTATRLMGHTNASILLDIYADVVESKLAESMKLIKIG